MNNNANLVEIFYFADEFCKEFTETMRGHLIVGDTGKKRRDKPSKLSDAEVITIPYCFSP